MKKFISIIAALTLCAALTGCNGISENSGKRSFEGLKLVKTSEGAYTINRVKSFEDLEERSELIVVGEFIDDSEICFTRSQYLAMFEKECLIEVVSSCPMKITKVLAGDANVGDVVNVLQKEGVDDDQFITDSPLTPMQKGDEWLFCLRLNTDERVGDGYWCVGDERGRYPTKNSGSNEVMCFSDYPELGVYEEKDFQEDFYNKLLEKYGEF